MASAWIHGRDAHATWNGHPAHLSQMNRIPAEVRGFQFGGTLSSAFALRRIDSPVIIFKEGRDENAIMSE